MSQLPQPPVADRVASGPIRVLALGGSTRPGSSSEQALGPAVDAARQAGALVDVISGRSLMLPIYDTEVAERTPEATLFLTRLSEADGLIVAAPGYHGSLSGMMKNVLDYVEDLRETDRVYLDGIAVGCIGVAYGWQAAVSTLQALRTIVHALRGWPTPMGAAINSSLQRVGEDGGWTDPAVVGPLQEIGRQVVGFAQMRRAHRLAQLSGE